MTEQKNILIIDGYGFIFRAYHVQPPLTSPKGLPVGALYGFTSMLLKVLNDFKPEHAVVVFDAGGKNFRHRLYDKYKAQRPPVPEDLIPQLDLVRTAALSLNFCCLEKEDFEADDIIATLAVQATALKENAVIVSSDKDLMQLINGHIKMYDPIKAKYISPADVINKFGVGPEKVREVLALTGDKSDNIPGVPSIGPKTAADLINRFGSVEGVLKSLDQIKSARQQEVLKNNRDMALLSWKLVGLDEHVDLGLNFDRLKWTPPTPEKISDFLIEYGFKSLYKRAEHLFGLKLTEHKEADHGVSNIFTEEISSPQQLDNVIEVAREQGIISIYLITCKNEPVSLALALKSKCYIINIGQKQNNTQGDFLSYGKEPQINEWFPEQIINLLENKAIKKIICNLKALLKFLDNRHPCNTEPVSGSQHDVRVITPQAYEDLELVQYTLSAGKLQHDFFSVAKEHEQIEAVITDSAQIVAGFFTEYRLLETELINNTALSLYKDIDLPLLNVLHEMEQRGIKIDVDYLHKLSRGFSTEIAALQQEIYAAVGGVEFNIGSPKQLGHILFEKMQLPFGKLSSKSKTWSTGAEILEKLSESGYAIADLLLKWRQLTKLQNTYTDTLPRQVEPATGRVHTTFLQNSTTTGRLSSHDPNIQNIPIRSTEGNKIRAAFIAESGNQLISADYSQIELRILSHIADIIPLKESFINGEDIHSQTACRIFKISREELTPEHRRKAKAINFGIIYGISPFGLSKQLNVPVSQAASYIDSYFAEYPGIKDYMERTKLYALEHGYVKNLFGRKCFVSGIQDKNAALRQFAERAAINAPIQGTNADIIKIAMINLDRLFKKDGLRTKMLLQIHDELIFEVPAAEVQSVMPLIKNIMEHSSPLSIPTIVDVRAGNNWMEVH